MDTKKLAEEFKKKPSGYDSDSHEVTIYENGVDDFISFLDAQGKLAEGEYRVGMQGGCHCVFKPDGMILLFGEDDEALVALVASLLNSQGAEIKRLGDANEKFENQEEIIQHLTTAVGNLRDKLTTAQAKVEELEENGNSTDRIVIKVLKKDKESLTAKLASLREANANLKEVIRGSEFTLDTGKMMVCVDCKGYPDHTDDCPIGQALSDNAESDPQDNSGSDSRKPSYQELRDFANLAYDYSTGEKPGPSYNDFQVGAYKIMIKTGRCGVAKTMSLSTPAPIKKDGE